MSVIFIMDNAAAICVLKTTEHFQKVRPWNAENGLFSVNKILREDSFKTVDKNIIGYR